MAIEIRLTRDSVFKDPPNFFSPRRVDMASPETQKSFLGLFCPTYVRIKKGPYIIIKIARIFQNSFTDVVTQALDGFYVHFFSLQIPANQLPSASVSANAAISF